MSMPVDEQPRIARFFTSIRRIPILIGKAGNSRIPGGPYTPFQFLVGAVVLVVGYNTMPLWGPLVGKFPLVRLIALAVISVFALWASGLLPTTRRKIHNLAFDAVGATLVPAAGKLNGRPVKLPAPHRTTGGVLIDADEFEDLDADLDTGALEDAPAPVLPDSPTPSAPAVPAAGFASGLDRLLEQARTKES